MVRLTTSLANWTDIENVLSSEKQAYLRHWGILQLSVTIGRNGHQLLFPALNCFGRMTDLMVWLSEFPKPALVSPTLMVYICEAKFE